ncbi:MAG: hypothetical protein K8I60_13795 [Anaerolineae bacterium]|nr:hypothetical protein [Anaerolineae bacterium]
MKNYSIEVRTDVPVLVSKWLASFNFKQDVMNYSNEVKVILDARTEPLYYLLDFREYLDFSIDDIVMAAQLAARSGNSNFHHRMVNFVIFVSSDPLLKRTAEGMNTPAIGNLDVRVFTTTEEALTYVRGL